MDGTSAMILGAAILGAAFLLGTMGRYELSGDGKLLLDRWKGRICLVNPAGSVTGERTEHGMVFKFAPACSDL